MAIKGLSEIRRLPRIGKIRLGIKEVSPKTQSEYPKAVDYFVCNADSSTPEWAAQAFHKTYGDQPRSLDVLFPMEDPNQFFSQFYRRYGKGTGLLCKSDGETATMVDTTTGEIQEGECNPDECEWYQKKHCRHIGTLQFLLPKVEGLGIWQIDTTSFHSIVNLNSGIDFVRGITGGRIAWIPLKLVVQPKEVQIEGRKKTVYVMALANEQMKLEEIIKASMMKPAEFLLPDLNLNEAPDDLFPQSLINPSPAQTMEAPKQPTNNQGVAPSGESLTAEHVKAFYTTVQKAGATPEIVKSIMDHVMPDKLNASGKLDWSKVSMQDYKHLDGLFCSGGWKELYQNIMAADSYPAMDLNDLPSQPDLFGGMKL